MYASTQCIVDSQHTVFTIRGVMLERQKHLKTARNLKLRNILKKDSYRKRERENLPELESKYM